MVGLFVSSEMMFLERTNAPQEVGLEGEDKFVTYIHVFE